MTKNVILNGLIMRFSHTIISLCIDYDAARTGIKTGYCHLDPALFDAAYDLSRKEPEEK